MGLASNYHQIIDAYIFVEWINARQYFFMYLRARRPSQKNSKAHLFINVEAMVKEEDASHTVNLNLSGWTTLTSLLGFLLCNHWSFLLLSFLLSVSDLSSQANLFGFHHVLTWIIPARRLFFIFLPPPPASPAECTWVYSSFSSFYVVNLGPGQNLLSLLHHLLL